MPATLAEIQTHQTELIRKALQASVFAAPMSAALPTALTQDSTTAPGTPELVALDSSFIDLGYVAKDDAYTWARDTELSEITSHGDITPTRRDITSDVSSLAFTAQETKQQNLEMYYNTDLSGITPDATTGEVAFSQPNAPNTRYYRIFAIAQDGSGDNAIWIARLLPRAMLSEPGEQMWSDTDNAMTYQMTLTGTRDSDAGYSIRHLFGGPGWQALLTDMGWA